MNNTLTSPLAQAICEAFVSHAVAKLLETVDSLDPIGRERRVNEALAGLRELESLGAEELVAYQKLVGHKVGEQLAVAARVSREALASPLGYRKWFSAVHYDVNVLFNRALEDYADGSDRDPIRLLFAQTLLIADAHARGLLGMPLKGPNKRKYTAAREFEPDDYPDPDVRQSIALMTFNDDVEAIATLRALSLTTDHDQDGRITLLLAAHGGDDADSKAALYRLAGRIIGAEPDRFQVQRRLAPSPTSMASHTLQDRARRAAQENS